MDLVDILIVIGTAASPILELRGAIPLAIVKYDFGMKNFLLLGNTMILYQIQVLLQWISKLELYKEVAVIYNLEVSLTCVPLIIVKLMLMLSMIQ